MKKSIMSKFLHVTPFFAIVLLFACQKEFESSENSLPLQQAGGIERDVCGPCIISLNATAFAGGTINISWQFESGNYTYVVQVNDVGLDQQLASFSTALSEATIRNAVSGHTYLISVNNGVGTTLQKEVLVP